jgi:hypothetical protein
VLDNGERPDAVVLQLKNALGMVEGRGATGERQGLERHGVSIAEASTCVPIEVPRESAYREFPRGIPNG